MTSKELRKKVLGGEHVFGTLIVSSSPRWPRIVAGLGLDFVFIDTEHIALDRAELSWMCQAYAALGLPPIVRIPSPDPYQAAMVADGGAAGVVAPYIESVEQAQSLRGAVKYHPVKGEFLARHLHSEKKCGRELAEYLDSHNANRLMIINVESEPAVENIDALLGVRDLDAVLIGPHDLSCSLGIPEQYHHPRFEEVCRYIFKKARAAGVGAGVHSYVGDVGQEISWMTEAGANLIIHSADLVAFSKSMTADIAQLRAAVGSKQDARGEVGNI